MQSHSIVWPTGPRHPRVVFLLSIILCAGLFSLKPQSAKADESANGLLVLPHATNVWSGTRGGTNQFTYQSAAPYPGKRAIVWISKRLRKADWQPLAYDFLNPTVRPTQMRAWHEFVDQTKYPDTAVRIWGGDWRDAAGDIVEYWFRYTDTSACCVSNPTDLGVSAIYTSAALLKQTEGAFAQLRKEQMPR